MFEYVSPDETVGWLVGEDENADLWVPYRRGDIVTRREYGWVRFNRRHPLHWLRLWNTRRRNVMVFLWG